MIETIFKAVVGITVFAGGWLTVQIAWRRVFAETSRNRCRAVRSVATAAVARIVKRDALGQEIDTDHRKSIVRIKEMRLQDYDIETQFLATVADTHPITPPESAEEVREITLDIAQADIDIRGRPKCWRVDARP